MLDIVFQLVDCNPRFGIMECIKKLKGTSARIMREEYPDLVKRLPNMWTRSAFISTVGTVNLNTIKRYIQNQKGV